MAGSVCHNHLMGGNRRVARVWVALTVVIILVSACGGEPTLCGSPTTALTVRGELVTSSIVQASFFNDDQHLVQLQTDDEVIEFEVLGEGGLLEIGERYQVGLYLRDSDDPSTSFAFLHSGEECSGPSTVALLDQDGELIEIDEPPAFTSPISARTFFLSALVFTVAVAMFGRLSTES